MKELILIKHESLSLKFLDIICNLKSSAWEYTIEEHKKWIQQNLKPNDIHVLLEEDGKYVAYLNLVQTHVLSCDENEIAVFGIGNVCAKIKGKGYGSALMKLVNDSLLSQNAKAILLCKANLLDFYSKLGYTINSKITDNVYLMSLNINNTFTYKGNLF